MIIVTLLEPEINVFLDLIRQFHDDRDELEMRVQSFYDSVVNHFLEKRIREHGHTCMFPCLDDALREGHFRKNGKLKKTIYIQDDHSMTIRLQRIRCDDLGRCQTIYINLLVPRCRLLITQIAELILAKSVVEAVRKHVNTNFTPWVIRYVRRKWAESWHRIVNHKCSQQLEHVLDVVTISSQCIRSIKRQFYQAAGTCIPA